MIYRASWTSEIIKEIRKASVVRSTRQWIWEKLKRNKVGTTGMKRPHLEVRYGIVFLKNDIVFVKFWENIIILKSLEGNSIVLILSCFLILILHTKLNYWK